MPDFVIQVHPEEYHDFVDYLTGLRFERVVLHAPAWRFKTPGRLLWQYAQAARQLLRQLRTLKAARTLVIFSHFGFIVKILARLRLLHYQRLICFGFFLQEPRWLRIFRWLVKLDRPNDHYVIFSEPEIELYQAKLGISPKRLHFVPLGDWGEARQPLRADRQADWGDYYFAGGRSNRDYLPLVETFRFFASRLVIVCSESNLEELRKTRLPQNVDVLCDVSACEFDKLLRGAKAGIIPLKNDMGSSGQSVALALMRNSKCILASDVTALHEYIEHGVSGYFMTDLAGELPALIQLVESQPDRAEQMGRAARARYERHFSRMIAAEAFEHILGSIEVESAA